MLRTIIVLYRQKLVVVLPVKITFRSGWKKPSSFGQRARERIKPRTGVVSHLPLLRKHLANGAVRLVGQRRTISKIRQHDTVGTLCRQERVGKHVSPCWINGVVDIVSRGFGYVEANSHELGPVLVDVAVGRGPSVIVVLHD